MPVEPPATGWIFGDPSSADDLDDLVAIGADLEPGTVLEAYRRGIFPMPAGRPGDPMYWFSPVSRGVLFPRDLRVPRSLRRSMRDFEIRVDTAFDEVVACCADPARPHGWINADIEAAYSRLHRLGWAHSVEAWQDDRLAGGLYGLAIGGLFAGESMFHRVRDASKVALVGLVQLLEDDPRPDAPRPDDLAAAGPAGRSAATRLVDVQWSTPHLASLGVTEIDRDDYLGLLPALFATPLPDSLAGPDPT